MTTRVYIGRLPRDARERDLEKLFRGYGDIREIRLLNGFGFVEFRDHRDADDVVYNFNGKTFMGEKLIVEFARGDRRRRDDRRDRDGRFAPPMRNPQYRLIVENLSSGCSWQDLKDWMRKAGEVTFADVHKERDGEGVVEFATYDDMKAALRKLDDTELKGKRIILREAPDNDYDRDRDRDRRRRSRSRSRSPRRRRSPSRSRSHSPRRYRRSRSKSRSPYVNGNRDHGSRSRSRSPRRPREDSRSPPKRSRSRSNDREKGRED